MAATAVGMILNDFWEIWLKTLDAGSDCYEVAHSLMECAKLFEVNLAPLAHPIKKTGEFSISKEGVEYVVSRYILIQEMDR